MKRKVITLENGVQVWATENFTDACYFMDTSEKLLLLKRKMNGFHYLLIFEKGPDEKYNWRDGSKHNEVRSTTVSQEEAKVVLLYYSHCKTF